MGCDLKERNMQFCNCTYDPCPRKGNCCECLHYHRKQGQLPACYFTEAEERTWDRSISFFVKQRSKR